MPAARSIVSDGAGGGVAQCGVMWRSPAISTTCRQNTARVVECHSFIIGIIIKKVFYTVPQQPCPRSGIHLMRSPTFFVVSATKRKPPSLLILQRETWRRLPCDGTTSYGTASGGTLSRGTSSYDTPSCGIASRATASFGTTDQTASVLEGYGLSLRLDQAEKADAVVDVGVLLPCV